METMKQPLVILTGPTAVGKTALSIHLAQAIGGEIISADSMQVYKGMDIGSAKIRPEEMQGVPHYLIDELEPDEEFHVVRFQQMAKKYLQQIYDHGHIPIVVGGTGFYIQALLYDIDFTENKGDPAIRQQLETLAAEKGAEYLHQKLAEVDPKSAEDIHANNVKRVVRALEFYQETGTRISEHNEQERQKKSPFHFAYFVLNDERKKLYERIDQRIDQMLDDGHSQSGSLGYTFFIGIFPGKGFKQMGKKCCAHADPVIRNHCPTGYQAFPDSLCSHLTEDISSGIRIFDRISQNIDKDLSNMQRASKHTADCCPFCLFFIL